MSPGTTVGSSRRDPPSASASTIVVPLDGSTHALVALPVAQRLAEIVAAMLQVVHVGEPSLAPRSLMERIGLTLEQTRGVVVDQATGQPAEAISRLARERHSLFIVMCTHTRAVTIEKELGSVAEQVLQQTPCPVVFVQPKRGLELWTLQRILLPHDGTPTMAAAIGPAADLARRAGAELDVLHVTPDRAGRSDEVGTFAVPRYLDQPQHEWPIWAREFLDRLQGLGQPPEAVRMRLSLARGEPGEEIARFAAAHDTDLVVLGWRGQFEPEHAVTVKTVIRQAPCPVLIVRVEPG